MSRAVTVSPISPKRASGILLHITSLPSRYGIGDLGPQAYEFVDFLNRTHQRIWQVLPLSPTDPFYGNSPYCSISAFAGNKLLISPELLLEDGLLAHADLEHVPHFPEGRCDFPSVIAYKSRLLEIAFRNFMEGGRQHSAYERFCEKNASWLEDFALFVVIKNSLSGLSWAEWPRPVRDRDVQALGTVGRDHREKLEKEKFWQYLFFEQWHRLRTLCREKGIRLFGDIAIYTSYDSTDVWAHPGIFKLDPEKRPLAVSGVPPDYFSSTGQLWGNPVYRWDVLKTEGFGWWLDRIGHCLSLYDILRIDHFRGLIAYWEIPMGETTAMNGRWVEVPSDDFLSALGSRFRDLPLVAEDLGIITDDVKEAMRRYRFPGMKVLQFAFSEDNPGHPYLPRNYEQNCLAYTGTHDNNTVHGWFECEASAEEKARFFECAGREVPAEEVSWEFIRLIMESRADQVMIPMQDILGLGADARMNRPSFSNGNWEWRMRPGQITKQLSERLHEMTETTGRG